jgi:hypothetical protein
MLNGGKRRRRKTWQQRYQLPARTEPKQPFWLHVAMGAGIGVFLAAILIQDQPSNLFMGLGFGALVALAMMTSRDAMRDLAAERYRDQKEAERKAAESAASKAKQIADETPKKPEDLALATIEEDAMPGLARLSQASDLVQKGEVRARLKRLGTTAERALEDLRKRPERAQASHRLFTYYVPRAADLGEAYAAIERRTPVDTERAAEIDGFLERLEEVFRHYSDKVLETELLTLDAEMRVLNDSIREDLAKG